MDTYTASQGLNLAAFVTFLMIKPRISSENANFKYNTNTKIKNKSGSLNEPQNAEPPWCKVTQYTNGDQISAWIVLHSSPSAPILHFHLDTVFLFPCLDVACCQAVGVLCPGQSCPSHTGVMPPVHLVTKIQPSAKRRMSYFKCLRSSNMGAKLAVQWQMLHHQIIGRGWT